MDPPAPESDEDARYRTFFTLFNAGAHFEAHEVLEPLWLETRGRREADFYKALIQVAGGFVHLGRGRTRPGRALIRRALELLSPYPATFEGLGLAQLRSALREKIDLLERP
jgi:predicted metal-dependent hydrolase